MVPRAGPLVLLHDWPTFTGQVTKVGAGSVGNAKRESTTWVRETKPTSPCRTCWKIWKNTGFGFFLPLVLDFFVGFLSRYHLPCICNSLELEPVILHGICYILAWSLCILHGICYIWPCLPSILHGICHILHFNLSFAWYLLHFGASNVHVGLLRVL